MNLTRQTFPAILFIVLIFIAAVYFAGPLVLEWMLVVKSPVRKADALVLMAGAQNHRLPTIVNLYQQGVAPKILLTNDGVKGPYSHEYKKNLYLVEWAREYLLKEGVPEDAIVLLDFSESGSYFDALNTKAFVLAHNQINSLLVVTSHYHTRRTLWVFKHVFKETEIDIGVYPVPKAPNYHGRLFNTMCIELIKLLYYKVRYGLLER